MKKKYKVAYNHWTVVFQHIEVISRIDSVYAIMCLSGYNSLPSLPYYIVLNHYMQCLSNHLHIAIMYPREKTKTYEMTVHRAKVEG